MKLFLTTGLAACLMLCACSKHSQTQEKREEKHEEGSRLERVGNVNEPFLITLHIVDVATKEPFQGNFVASSFGASIRGYLYFGSTTKTPKTKEDLYLIYAPANKDITKGMLMKGWIMNSGYTVTSDDTKFYIFYPVDVTMESDL